MTAVRSVPTLLVAQIGARRGYAVPRAMAEAGCLQQLITDACAATLPWRHMCRCVPHIGRPPALRSVCDRHVGAIGPAKVLGLLGYFLATRIGSLRKRSGEHRVSYWVRQNEAFGRGVCAAQWGQADGVYAFNGAALEIFQRARSEDRLRILDQTAAPWRFNSALLEREAARWPGWEISPNDRDPDGRMIEREEAEWELADRIVCGSPFVVEAIRAVGGPVHKCRVVPYPLPKSHDRAPRSGRHRSPFRVLFVGTLQLRKGIQYVWDVAGRFSRDEVEFRTVGPSDLTPSAESRLRSRVDWIGRVGRGEVWRHYEWADLFLLPTLSEGSANVCWESLAAGTRVITTLAAGVESPGVETTAPETDDLDRRLRRRMSLSFSDPLPATQGRSVADYGRDLVSAVVC